MYLKAPCLSLFFFKRDKSAYGLMTCGYFLPTFLSSFSRQRPTKLKIGLTLVVRVENGLKSYSICAGLKGTERFQSGPHSLHRARVNGGSQLSSRCAEPWRAEELFDREKLPGIGGGGGGPGGLPLCPTPVNSQVGSLEGGNQLGRGPPDDPTAHNWFYTIKVFLKCP